MPARNVAVEINIPPVAGGWAFQPGFHGPHSRPYFAAGQTGIDRRPDRPRPFQCRRSPASGATRVAISVDGGGTNGCLGISNGGEGRLPSHVEQEGPARSAQETPPDTERSNNHCGIAGTTPGRQSTCESANPGGINRYRRRVAPLTSRFFINFNSRTRRVGRGKNVKFQNPNDKGWRVGRGEFGWCLAGLLGCLMSQGVGGWAG
jgi:hypothetical protein